MKIVLDASAALALILGEPATPGTKELLDLTGQGHFILVPDLFWAEIANGFLLAERRGRVTCRESEAFSILRELVTDTTQTPLDGLLHGVLPIARRTGLTVYDAIYLELAWRLGATLATADRKLAEAAQAEHIQTL